MTTHSIRAERTEIHENISNVSRKGRVRIASGIIHPRRWKNRVNECAHARLVSAAKYDRFPGGQWIGTRDCIDCGGTFHLSNIQAA